MTRYRFLYTFFLFICTISILGSTHIALAAINSSGISASNYNAQLCVDTSCTPSTAPDYSTWINFGYFTTASASNVLVTDSALTGYIWGSKFGWVVLNCSNTTSGCSSTNGNFKVANTSAGVLSGYAWGEIAGWINFGPFSGTTPVVQSVIINTDGKFSGTSSGCGTPGYAWSQNFGWLKFDCSVASSTVATSEWRPLSQRSSGGGGSSGGSSGTSIGGGDNLGGSIGGDTGATDSGDAGANLGGEASSEGESSGDTGAGNIGVGEGINSGDTGATDSGDAGANLGGEASSEGESSGDTGAGNTGAENGGGGIGESISRGFSIVFSEGIAPIASAISSSVSAGIDSAKIATKKAAKQAKAVLDTPAGAVATKTVATVGVVSGASVSIATALFANPLSFSELFLIPIRLWALFMAALGIKKRNRPWGTVYDSVTKQPLDPAYVVLQDMNGEEVATSITDLDGRYGFLMNPGTYKILANKTNYVFPSTKLAGKVVDEIYNDLYFGETITVTEEGQIIAKNIPLDPIKFDWNEFAKKEQHLMKFYSRRSRFLSYFSNILFGFGFTVTAIAVLVAPKGYNLITFSLYCILLVLKRTVLKPKPQGTVSDTATGKPLSFAIIRVVSVATNQEIIHKITDKMGIYYCLIPNGTYYIKVERKNPDETYTLIHTSAPLEVKKGYIDEKIKV